MRAVLLCVLAGAAVGAAPRAAYAPGQGRLMRERDALWRAGARLWKERKDAEAIASLEKALRIELTVLGPWHVGPDATARALAGMYRSHKDWLKEAAYRRVVVEARSGLYGAGHWKTADARLALQEALAQSMRTPAQRAALAQAGELDRKAHDFYRAGQRSRAIPLLKQSLDIIKEVRGQGHPDFAAGLGNLAFMHQSVGDYRRALALSRQALAVTAKVLGENHPEYAVSLNNLAGVCRDMGALREALPLFRKSLAVTRAALGDTHPTYATSLHNLALVYCDMGAPRAAFPLARRGLAIRKQLYGTKHPAYAHSLNSLAAVYKELGEYNAALPLFRQALALRKELLGEKHPSYGYSLLNLATLHDLMGDHKQALEMYTDALEITKRAVGEKHPNYALGLNNLASLHLSRAEFEKALPLYERALDITVKAYGEKHPRHAICLNNLAALHKERGDHRRALALYEKARAIYKEALGDRHPAYATSLCNLALLHQAAGDHGAALSLAGQALAIRKAALGEKHPEYAAGLNNLALVYQAKGDYRRALGLYQESLAVTKQAQGEEHSEYATTLNNLATLYSSTGDHKQALHLLRRALRARKEGLGEKHPEYATCLNNLGGLYWRVGDLEAALPLYRQALSINRAALGEKHPACASGLNNLAALAAEAGDHKEAQSLFRKALALRKQALGEEHPSYATSLHNLGGFYLDRADYERALPLFRQALAIRGKALGEMHPSRAASLQSLARLYLNLGRPSAALRFQEQSLVITRRALAVNAAAQSERQQLEAMEALRYRLHIRLCIPDESAASSHEHVLSWKGATFAAQRARRLLLQAGEGPTTRQVARELLDATRSLALLAGRHDAASLKRAEKLAHLIEEKQVRLGELSRPLRASRYSQRSEEYRQLLPSGAVLVDFMEYHGTNPARPHKGQKALYRLAAWVVRRDAPTVRIDLGPSAPVEELIQSWRQGLESGRVVTGAPARLREKVWAPLEKHLTGATAVLISPDGALGKLPFAALPGKKKGAYLLEEVPLAVLPVPQALPQLLQPAGGKASLLALGGVGFGDGPGAWPSLPASGAEASAAARQFRALRKGEAATLSGEKAGLAALREALPRHRFLHLATHGFFAPPSMKSALERKPTGLFGPEGATGWHPGLLCGLVLAGANNPSRESDGILTALEIAEMDLSNVELAVLSACQTGLGKEAAGEGMLGLQRAFAVAGCKSVVSSLWSVHDAATGVLMERFYFHLWQKKLPKLEALRQAQLDVLRHPEWVERRVKELADVRGLRGLGKVSEKLVAGKKQRRAPLAWWAAWQLSGDWR